MRRLLSSLVLAGAVLAVPAVAPAAASAAASAVQLPPRSVQVTGTLSSTGAYSFTVQMPGRPTGVLGALTSAADKLAAEDYPYVWGGGHAQAGVASVGSRGPGHNGRRRGYDCSGAVAAVLEASGLWPAGSGVPNDAGVISYLLQNHEIAPGAGTGPREVTLYDRPGVHIFMNINGRFFGTSDGGVGGDRRGGPGWLDDGAPDVQNRRFRRYHFIPSVLKARTDAGYTLAFQPGRGVDIYSGFPIGARVRVAFKTTNQGTMVAQSVSLLGERSVSGVVQPLAAGTRLLTIVTARRRTLNFPTTGDLALVQALIDGQVMPGDTVSVSYVRKPSLTVISVTVTSTPTTTTTTTTTTPTTTTPTTTTPTTTTPTTTTPTTTTPTTTTPTTTAPTTTAATGAGQSPVAAGWTGGQGF